MPFAQRRRKTTSHTDGTEHTNSNMNMPWNVWNILMRLSCVNLHFSINNVELKSDVKLVKDSRDGLFDVKVVAKYPKNALKSETIINCQLSMPGTDYNKKRETVYYGRLNQYFDSRCDLKYMWNILHNDIRNVDVTFRALRFTKHQKTIPQRVNIIHHNIHIFYISLGDDKKNLTNVMSLRRKSCEKCVR